jgi:PHP family Zn ribbon phosphoesterase
MVKMFKNIEAAKFCDVFVNLHNFKKETLDIVNQYDCVKPDYTNEITMIMNETITLSKIKVQDRDVYDTMNLYGFTILPYIEEYFFMIAERHSIMKKLGKKVVRTIGLQISTPTTTKILEEYYDESKNAGLFDYRDQIDRTQITKLD